MSGPRFDQTRTGQVFFETTIPQLNRAIDRLAAAIEKQNQLASPATSGVCDECSKEGASLFNTRWDQRVCGECWDDITNGAERPKENG